jgi:hypothetical protein
MATPDEIRDNAETQYAQIRNQKYLPEVARQKIAAVYVAAEAQIDALMTAANAATNSRRVALERQLYGLPASATGSDIIALRDAQDRASNFDDARSIAALDRAAALGDDTMTRAILETAFNSLDIPVLDHYLTLSPSSEPAVQELVDILRVAGGKPNFASAFEYFIGTPPELAGLSPWRITEAAAGATPTSQVFG